MRISVVALGVVLAATAFADEQADRFFEKNIGPILSERCISCHNTTDRQGGLSLISGDDLRAGGESGEVVVAGDADGSLLVQLVTGPDAAMPAEPPPLSDAQVGLIRQWVSAGARWPRQATLKGPRAIDTDWWSLRPLEQVTIPRPLDADSWVRTPIDAFVLQQLHDHGLVPSRPAERRELARRLYFDLLGLPPSPQELRAFCSSSDPLAYERLVEKLLASPRYGERWARHWLDVVHYGDTHGYDKDKPRPHAWPYRDYVIRSCNGDKPYSRFVREQLAGDYLWPDDGQAIVATGFIAAGPWDFIGHAEVPESKLDGKVARHLDRDDMVTSTMNTFISTTVQCAQCHDHKFDPVSQRDYYCLQAVFAALDRADRPFDSDPQIARRRRQLQQLQRQLESRRQQLTAADERATDDWQADVDLGRAEPVAEEARCALAEVREALSRVDAELEQLPAQEQVYAGCVHHGSGAFRGTGESGGVPREIHVLIRGDVRRPGPLVNPGTLRLMDGHDGQLAVDVSEPEGRRRAALADWIVRRDNPLVWRSIVNRVWLYHFGHGIVDTPNDFGRMGDVPSHPQLLDWLAVWFRDHGESIKQLHRLIVTSQVYRQSSLHTGQDDGGPGAAIDAQNRWLWHMNRRPLDAESLRDTVLTLAGRMDLRMYGPGFRDFVIEKPEHSPHYEYEKFDPDQRESHRRSVYRFLVRSQQQPFMERLDCADPSQLVGKRDTTITAIQALALLNDRFMIRMAQHFADQLDDGRSSIPQQIEAAYWQALSRPPTANERTKLAEFARQHGMANVCRLILNLNEFAFVD